ncbi:LytR/AlgR family response regulator transcription factor [Emticicia sp. SJ17W-69]|uniref:LytR/AlgR family response regulator transcription factor n=1 Tax=Emticicia sp. SJ17W-69 TaxID=3421657 RepID=UPI003EBA1F26
MEDLIKVGGRIKLFSKDVAYFEADINYTIIHYTIGKRKIVATTLGHIQERIGNGFIRPNKSFLINLEFINSCLLGELLLQNDLKVNMSRRKKNQLTIIVNKHIEQKKLQINNTLAIAQARKFGCKSF